MIKHQPLEPCTEESLAAGAIQAPTRRRASARGRPVWLALVPLWAALVLALVGVLSLSSGRALASSAQPGASTITITSETQTYTYASRITFQMQASDSAGHITSARLEISVPQLDIDHQESVPVTQPGAQVSLTYQYDPSNDYLPPFTPVTYQWMLGDDAQHSLTGADQHFDFVDTRFNWQHLTQSDITLYWYNQNVSFGQNTLNTAVQEATSIEKDLNGTLTAPIRVLVYASNQDLRGGLPPGTPDWAGGVALIEIDEALIVSGNPAEHAFQRDMPHELTHLIFHEIAGLGCGGCPLWFDEGMAVYHQIYHEPEMQERFDLGVRTKSLLLFSSISDRFPQDSDQAELAYAESWNFIKYLYKTYGQPKVAQVVDSLRTTAFDDAFKAAFGLDVPHMESQWRVSLGLAPTISKSAATPATDNTQAGSQTPGSAPETSNGNETLTLIGLAIFALLFMGLLGGGFIWWRGQRAPVPAAGAPWPYTAPLPGAPLAPNGMQQPPGYQQEYSPLAVAPGQDVPGDERYQRLIEQRHYLIEHIGDLLASEQRLEVQRTQVERQIALYADQEQQARAASQEDLALLALDRRQRLQTHLPNFQQQLEQVRNQKQQAILMEQRLGAEIEALAYRQPAGPGRMMNAGPIWPQPTGSAPSARRFSQE
jgi:hypothetical protein